MVETGLARQRPAAADPKKPVQKKPCGAQLKSTPRPLVRRVKRCMTASSIKTSGVGPVAEPCAGVASIEGRADRLPLPTLVGPGVAVQEHVPVQRTLLPGLERVMGITYLRRGNF